MYILYRHMGTYMRHKVEEQETYGRSNKIVCMHQRSTSRRSLGDVQETYMVCMKCTTVPIYTETNMQAWLSSYFPDCLRFNLRYIYIYVRHTWDGRYTYMRRTVNEQETYRRSNVTYRGLTGSRDVDELSGDVSWRSGDIGMALYKRCINVPIINT